jgi:hypothetical protein
VCRRRAHAGDRGGVAGWRHGGHADRRRIVPGDPGLVASRLGDADINGSADEDARLVGVLWDRIYLFQIWRSTGGSREGHRSCTLGGKHTGFEMEIQHDQKGQPYIEWEQIPGAFKRAWIISREPGDEKSWANVKRYLNVVRCNSAGHPGGNPTDFPIFNQLPDEQILLAFVHATNAITGCAT